jgi:putative nucleotidyltransferase with HDIG domain
MLATPAKIHVACEDAADAATLCRELMRRGFAAEPRPLDADCPEPLPERDILVIAGDFDRLRRGAARFPHLCRAVRERTIVFLDHLPPREFADLARAGFSFINPLSAPSVDNLIFLVSELDPEAVYRASKQQALRAGQAAAIETGMLSFFQHLRSGGAIARAEQVEQHRRNMDALIGLSPMSVWLDLFQNYHDGTAQHCSLVSGFTLAFARKLGFAERDVSRLFDAAFFHDVGKALIPLEILDKPDRLIGAEWTLMQSHAQRGYEILIRDDRTAGVARIARDHHEYLDGTGYPNGLKSAEIDDPTRLLTICDIFAALVEKRAYKAPKAPDEAYSILMSLSGTKLDPDLLRVFESVVADYDGRLATGAADPGGMA